MHQITGTDSQDLGGGDLAYKGTDPTTEVHKGDMNQILKSLQRVVTQGGEALLANDAADIADDWMQVVRSINRLARKEAAPVSAVFDAGPSLNITQTLGTHYFRLEEDGGSEPDGLAYPDTGAEYVGKKIIIHNATTTRKRIATSASAPHPAEIPLAPGEAMVFLGITGTDCAWIPLGEAGEIAVTISCKLARAGSLDDSNNRNFEFRIDPRNKKTLMQPTTAIIFQITLTSAVAFVYLGPADDSVFDSSQVAKTNDILVGTGYAFDGAGLAEIVGIYSYTAGNFQIKRFAGSNFPTGTTISISLPPLSFINAS